jgi:hypothetical protein
MVNFYRTVAVLLSLCLAAAPLCAADLNQSSWSEVDANNNSAPPAGWPEGQSPSSVNDSARAMAGALKRFYNHSGPFLTAAGTNTLTLTYTVAPAAYVRGDCYTFLTQNANTGAVTLNVNSLGAVSIVTNDAQTLQGGEYEAGQMVTVCHDGTYFRDANIKHEYHQATGYVKLAGGIVLQWGSVTFSAENTKAVTFQYTFPTAIFSLQTTIAQAAGGTISHGPGTVTTSGFNFNVSTAVSTTGYWWAVGH